MSEVTEQVLSQETIDQLRTESKNDLYFFAKAILGFDWLDPEVHLPICRILEKKENNRVKVVLPRSWLKSTLGSIAYPIWRVIRNPNVRILIMQNTFANACKKLAVIRGKFESCPLFRILFPELLPTPDCTWSTDALSVPRTVQSAEATFEAAGTRTKTVSRHYNLIIEDDTVAPDLDDLTSGALLPSRDDVEQAIGSHRMVIPLLVDPLEDQILIIGTRWFERDLISWNDENEPHYITYRRAVRETDGVADESGDIVWTRFNEKVLVELETALGPYLYSCLYMNKPIRSTDMVFQTEWLIHDYETTPRDLIVTFSIDLASDPADCKGDPDYNVIMATGKDIVNGGIYVLEYFHKRCNPSELIDALFDMVSRWKPVKVRLEAVAYQKSLLHWIRERKRQSNIYFLIEPFTYGGKKGSGKNMRIMGLQPLFKAKMIHLRSHHRQLRSELTAFPYAQYDDLSDALSMQIPMWNTTRSRVEEERPDPADNPFSLDSAIREIDNQKESRGVGAYSSVNINLN